MKPLLQDAERNIVSEQAAKWLSELAHGNVEQRAAFVAWLKQSPRHVEEFLFASATLKVFWKRDGESEPVPGSGVCEIERIVAEALAAKASTNVVSLDSKQDAPSVGGALSGQEVPGLGVRGLSGLPSQETLSRRRRTSWLTGIAAAIAIASFGGLLVPRLVSFLSPHSFTTSMGEQRTVRLFDGSVVYLNARSRIEINFSPNSRDIELDKGEAVFKVQRDAARPFRVHTGDAVVQAIGTQFNVYRRPQGTTVSVLEGKVEIRSADASASGIERSPEAASPSLPPSPPPRNGADNALLIAAGEQASITSPGKIVRRAQPDIAAAVAWRERRLVFHADRLEDIASEFSRYGPRHIRLEDDIAREKRITGTFDADDPASLVLFLEKLDELSVQGDGDDFVVRGR